jgi:hypothetical protein
MKRCLDQGLIGCKVYTEVKISDHAFTAIPILIIMNDKALLHHLVRDADGGKHFQRRWMDRARARIVKNLVAAFKQGERNAAPRQIDRDRKTDRTAACDQNTFLCSHFLPPLIDCAPAV